MRTLMLAFALAACAPVLTPPDRPLTATEAGGLDMLHRLRALDPCHRDCACHTDAQPPRWGLSCASLGTAVGNKPLRSAPLARSAIFPGMGPDGVAPCSKEAHQCRNRPKSP